MANSDDVLNQYKIVAIPTKVTDKYIELDVQMVPVEQLGQLLEERAISYQQETGMPLPPFWPKI